MFFVISRILILCLIALGLVTVTNKMKLKKTKLLRIIICIVSIMICTLTTMFPLENLFYTFKSPEEAYNYFCTGDIKDMVYGKESCMVVYSNKKNSCAYKMFTRSSSGFKLPTFLDKHEVSKVLGKDGMLTLYRIEGTTDYYVAGTCNFRINKAEISDNLNSDFKFYRFGTDENVSAETNNIINSYPFTYAYVDNLADEYYITIGDKKLTFEFK